MKKALLAILMLLVVAGIALAMYVVFFGGFAGPTTPPEVTPPEVTPPGVLEPSDQGTGGQVTQPGGQLPGSQIPDEVADGGITVVRPVATAPTVGAAVSTGGQLGYYDRNDGRFYRVGSDNTVDLISDKRFFNVSEVKFADNGDIALLEYPDGSNISFDFRTGKQVTLPSHWEEFEFAPGTEQLVAKNISSDPDSNYLVMVNADGSGARPVKEIGTGAANVIVAPSPSSQVIAFSTNGRPEGLDSREVFFIGQRGENFKSMLVQGLDFRPKWTPDSERLLYSVASSATDYKPSLWIVDASGDNIGRNRRTINVNTWADKCTFADDSTVYCAVPEQLPRGAGLQPNIADSTPDNIYRIDIETGLQTLIAVPEGSHTVESLMLSPDGSNLYFTDKTTGILNTVRLSS